MAAKRDQHRHSQGESRKRDAPPQFRCIIDPAVQILRERFARGEIGEAEFLNASRALGAPLPPPGPPAGPPVKPPA
jgi:Predicted membrane protein (DUF2078).